MCVVSPGTRRENTRSLVRARELKQAIQREDDGRSKGDWSKQVLVVFDGKSRPCDIGADEQGER